MNDGGGVPEMHFIMKGWATPNLYDYYIYTCLVPYIRSNDNVRNGTVVRLHQHIPAIILPCSIINYNIILFAAAIR